MTPTTLVFVYGSALFAVSLLGSSLPRRFQMTHTRTQMVLSLVSVNARGSAIAFDSPQLCGR